MDEQFVAAFHLWYIYDAQARHPLAESIVGDVHRLAAASANDELLVQAGHADWTTSFVRGAFTRCLRATEEGLARASVANVDNVHAVAISRLSARIGALSHERTWEVERALGYAFDIDRLKEP